MLGYLKGQLGILVRSKVGHQPLVAMAHAHMLLTIFIRRTQ
jgi:hypothetical protein